MLRLLVLLPCALSAEPARSNEGELRLEPCQFWSEMFSLSYPDTEAAFPLLASPLMAPELMKLVRAEKQRGEQAGA